MKAFIIKWLQRGLFGLYCLLVVQNVAVCFIDGNSRQVSFTAQLINVIGYNDFTLWLVAPGRLHGFHRIISWFTDLPTFIVVSPVFLVVGFYLWLRRRD